MKTYWISFVKKKCVGVCIVDAEDIDGAIKETFKQGINPGGEAMIFEMPDTESAKEEMTMMGKNKLITPEQLEALDYKKLKDVDIITQALIETDESVSFLCEIHNKEIKP